MRACVGDGEQKVGVLEFAANLAPEVRAEGAEHTQRPHITSGTPSGLYSIAPWLRGASGAMRSPFSFSHEEVRLLFFEARTPHSEWEALRMMHPTHLDT